ncbi:MAG: hypothetical protein IK079_00650 [Desulfovibrio sp.]|nr:hypothetical protein [Desulfovibrio sp.]
MRKNLAFIGTYSAHRDQINPKNKKELFFVWSERTPETTTYYLQELDEALVPRGKIHACDAATFLEYFNHEPQILANPISKPDINDVPKPHKSMHLGEKQPPKTGMRSFQKRSFSQPEEPIPPKDINKTFMSAFQKNSFDQTGPISESPKKSVMATFQKNSFGQPDPFAEQPNTLLSSYSFSRPKRNFVPEEPPKKKSPSEVDPKQAQTYEKVLRADFQEAFKSLDIPHERNRALRLIKKIADQKEGINKTHKYMFRDFTVALRKASLPEIALLFASRTVSLAPEDDHALFNLARIYGMLNRYDDGIKELKKAMELKVSDHDLTIYKKLLHYLEREKNLQY